MKHCKNCGKDIPNTIKIDGKVRNTQRRSFCLDCSPFGAHNTKRDVAHLTRNLHTNEKIPISCVCQQCNREYLYTRKNGGTLSQCNSCWTKKRRDTLKQEYKQIAGGCCRKCGYDKCSSGLHFHHINPEEKLFGISNAYNAKKSQVEAELKKCVLICANCHAELHEGLWKIEDLDT